MYVLNVCHPKVHTDGIYSGDMSSSTQSIVLDEWDICPESFLFDKQNLSVALFLFVV